MSIPSHQTGVASGGDKNAEMLTAQLKAATEILQKAAADRALLAGLSEAERTQLFQAAGEIFARMWASVVGWSKPNRASAKRKSCSATSPSE